MATLRSDTPARPRHARSLRPGDATGDASTALEPEEFNDLAALAAHICGTPWGLMTVSDAAAHASPLVLGWSGPAHQPIRPLVSLATDVARENQTVVVSDLRADPRHRLHPAVAHAPRLRFCTTVALLTPAGRRVGTLSVLDPATRTLSASQLARLQLLAGQIATLLGAPQLQRDVQRLMQGIRQVSDDQHARMTLRSIGDGVVTLDRGGRITFMNDLAEHLTGWTLAGAVGKRLAQVVTLKNEDGQSFTLPDLESSGFSANPLTARTVLVRRDGHEISIEGTFAPILADDRSMAGTVFTFRNVTVARRVAAELSHQATHDPLTGLANRRALERRIGQALKTCQSGSSHALLYLDLDQFKAVNDSAGHLAGDELLRQLSTLLKQHLRESDLLARLGGDEFGVLLENCDPGHAETVAEKLRLTVEQFSFIWKDRAFDIGVSIGLVNMQDDALTLTEVLSQADEACYGAKAAGRNRVYAYQPGAHARAQHHTEREWMLEIKAALREQRLFLCRQPIFAVERERADADGPGHAEVFVRMRARNGAIVPPMAFIPAAERFRLMPALDRWVIDAVLGHLAADRADDGLYAVNLSGASLLDETFPSFLRERFEHHGLAPGRLCFEITETAAIAHLNRTVELIDELRELGCLFAIDDFGSGMSSFGYLKHLKVDYLKIDGSLVQGIVEDPIHYAMVESINRIGQLMGIRTVAEFVEDEAIFEAVRTIGVDCAQGYGLARPQNLERRPG